MKIRETSYTFDASAKTITFSSPLDIKGMQLIVNVKSGANTIIYNFVDVAKGGSFSGAILTLVYNTTGMSDSDPLAIYYEDGSASVPITNSYLDVALSSRTKPADQQHAIIDSGSCTATVTNLDVALSTRTKPADQQHAIIDSGSCAITATLTAKQNYGAYTALDVTHLQSLGNSATAGWKSATIDNRTTKAQDYRIQCLLPTADTAPGTVAAVFVFVAPGMNNGAAWAFADGGTATPPDGTEGTYSIAATTNNLKFLGALAYTTQHQTIQGSFCLSDAVGASMPEGFILILVNNSGAALSTGCIVAVEAITGSLA